MIGTLVIVDRQRVRLADHFESARERGIEHLVCDLPSVDRAQDGGRLLAHRAFWGVPDGATEAAAAARPRCTITELAYVPDEAPDGLYLLDLQVAAFMLDAAPSRPLLYPISRS